MKKALVSALFITFCMFAGIMTAVALTIGLLYLFFWLLALIIAAKVICFFGAMILTTFILLYAVVLIDEVKMSKQLNRSKH